ncbi:MAG TPA: AMP-dependent synthetase, partial [Paracoccus sp. (in: a-proteobacteria)]|nr:AMP-dependent synthetase [Paracoccus sp. (in: a-proteobacteria)]
MAQEQFRLHGDFRLIDVGRPGENTALLARLARLIAAGQSFAISTASALRIDALPVPPDQAPQLSCQTSGSSGRPKRILRSQASWISSFEVNRQAFALTGTDRHAILGSLASSLASYAAVEAMHLGTGLID